MNAHDTTHWDLAQMRARASRERAQAFLDLKAQLGAWLHDRLTHGAAHARRDECLDGCG